MIVSSNRKRLAREIIKDLIKEVVYKIEGKNIVPESPERKRFNKPPKTPLQKNYPEKKVSQINPQAYNLNQAKSNFSGVSAISYNSGASL